MSIIEVIALSIGLAGFAVAFVLQFRLRHHVSSDRVRALLNQPSELYPPGIIPPRAVLDEKGQRLLTILYTGGGIFIASILVMLVLTQVLPHVAA
jgi:hypothetical protein